MLILITIAFCHTLFFIVLILSKKQKSKEDYLLACWLMLIIVHFSGFYSATQYLIYYEFIVELSGVCVFLHGPILLSYLIQICKLSTDKTKFYYHYFPAITNLLLIPFLVFYDNDTLSLFLGFLKIFSSFYYSFLILRKLKEQENTAVEAVSDFESKKLRWFKMLTKGFLTITSIGMFSLLFSEFHLIKISMNGDLFTSIFLIIFIFILSYLGLQQTNVFVQKAIIIPNNQLNFKKTATKYKSTGLKTEHSESEYKKVLHFMQEYKPYLDSQITLSKLANLVQIPSNQLSQVINQNSNQNFFNFINSFRIDTVINNLDNGIHKEQTLLSIAFASGFNSKASFNRAFKKVTQQTPSNYIKQIKDESNIQ
mgnify:CR=1 FL=1